MIEYHKIDSVYFRDPDNHNKTFLEGQWTRPEFEYLARNEWIWTEKVDGTNIRVEIDNGYVTFGGRTAAAQIPATLITVLNDMFPAGLVLHDHKGEPIKTPVTLYGEGYGAKIQKGGGAYKPDGQDFVLFDVMINGVWLKHDAVCGIAEKLDINVVPIIGRGGLVDAINHVKEGFDSQWGPFIAEGLVCRPSVDMRNREGHRIITKIKHRDFVC